MPLYEYMCRDCAKPFEAFVTAQRTPSCPVCSGENLAKLLSSPGMVGVSAGRADASSCDMPAPMCGAQGGRCGCQ
jgi:putative FmdB family regulatory protein